MFHRKSALLILAALCHGTAAQAGIFTFTNRAAFTSALATGGYATTVDSFESYTLGTTFASGGGLGGYSYTDNNGTGLDFVVEDQTDTSSPTQGLGLRDPGGSDLLTSTDSIDIGFAATHGFGLEVITEPGAQDGDLVLTIGGTQVNLLASALQTTLPDGGTAYFLGLYDDTGTFTSATIAGSGGWGFWNIDDVTAAYAPAASVPEPATGGAVLLGLGLLGAARRRTGHALHSR
ncbi:PEP-CTERM sorting domain-containing protein [Methylomagnum ishizawai]|uniref:PEP-CTERM sorting domain-containing protein n=1 Tax=Methylomagnum ishizawai TaxID=1760988 RepID=UPI001C320C4D|nr:PEP-CTERM sorting domain-containing protein [Methylomagnum ishizawai]BBL74520.1 hypothetical protein MishRS11D_16180 [Methylomagnum ishizawai]